LFRDDPKTHHLHVNVKPKKKLTPPTQPTQVKNLVKRSLAYLNVSSLSTAQLFFRKRPAESLRESGNKEGSQDGHATQAVVVQMAEPRRRGLDSVD